MLFNAFFNRESIAAPGNVATTWQIAYGCVDSLSVENIFWRDNKVIIIAPDRKAVALSNNQRFVVVGNVWLSNRRELSVAYDISINNDIQLVAQLWEKLGIKTFKLLVGMFGLVIWDKHEQILYSGRDCTGSRTIYYTTNSLTRWLAPSLRTLAPYRSKDLDVIALRDYLCCAFVPGDRTLWNDVKELRPGTILKLPSGETHFFWQLKEQIIDSDKPLSWHGQKLRQLLDQVIKEYLPQNKPVGVLLSGGLDSSSVTALVSKLHDAPVHTFSIHFGAECPNELEFSSLVAEHCQTQHHILEITFKDMWERLPEVMMYLDDPIGDPLTVPNLLVAQLAREYVETILNGEGGDPCFGGPKNQPMLINNLYGSITNQDTLQAYLTSFQKCAVDLPMLLKPDVWKAVSNAPSVFTEDLYSKDNYLNRLMAINIKYKGADQILTKVNNTSTAAGLLGLSPLFDQRVVDLSMQIPPQYKLSGVEEKAVLKQAVADIVPDAIINRPKSGMMVPVQLGFRKYWQREARSLLLSRNAMTAPYFNQALVKDWLNYRGDTWRRYGVKLWLLVSLEMWLQVNKS